MTLAKIKRISAMVDFCLENEKKTDTWMTEKLRQYASDVLYKSYQNRKEEIEPELIEAVFDLGIYGFARLFSESIEEIQEEKFSKYVERQESLDCKWKITSKMMKNMSASGILNRLEINRTAGFEKVYSSFIGKRVS